jgi:hypothetical protein
MTESSTTTSSQSVYKSPEKTTTEKSETQQRTEVNPPPKTASTPPPPPPPKKPQARRSLLFPVIIVLIVAVIGIIAYFWGQPIRQRLANLTQQTESTPTPAPTETPAATACTLEALICPDGSSVGRVGPNCEFAPCPSPATPAVNTQNWDTLQTTSFTLRYPEDFRIEEEGSSYILTKAGPTQRAGTELYDGVAIIINWHDLDGASLSEYVDQHLAATKNDGISTVVRGKEPITIGQYQGYSYVIEGLGQFTKNFIVKEGSNQALQIEYLVADDNNQGYQRVVDQVLASIQLN